MAMNKDWLNQVLVTVSYANREFDNYDHVLHKNNANKLIDEIESLRAQLAQYKQDAERKDVALRLARETILTASNSSVWIRSREVAIVAIDAAMKEVK